MPALPAGPVTGTAVRIRGPDGAVEAVAGGGAQGAASVTAVASSTTGAVRQVRSVVDSKFGFPAEQATAADRVVTVKRF